MIELINVHKTFGYDKKYALRDISFKINDGESFAVLGRDGAGKSTLLNVLAGCLPPSSGQVLMDGADLYFHAREKLRRIGYMPSRLYLYPEMTVSEYISYIFEIKGCKKSISLTDGVLELCSLTHCAKSLIATLSGADTAKIKLAQAIAGNPSVLILDEPTLGLRREDAAAMRSLLKKLRNNYTFILSSTLLREATELCDNVLIMNRGKIAVKSSISELTSGTAALAVMSLRVYSDDEHTEEFILALSEYCEVLKQPSREIGSTDLLLTYPADNDIRPIIWQETVKRNIPILEMTRKDVSLEEMFLQVTGEN